MESAKAVLVTGASSGIGRKVTERLSQEGYFVYAGARKRADLESLQSIRNVQAVSLDVTCPDDIAAAFRTISSEVRGLYGLVNNAGVATIGPILGGNEREFELVMAVNVHGVYQVTRTFAPLVAAEAGRIVMVGSLSGILAWKDVGAYSMSKHAIEAFTDSLAEEMAALNVHVSVIEPGDYNTEICNNAVARTGPDKKYEGRSKLMAPDEVATVISLALFESHPKRRYLVVSNEEEARVTIEKQIAQLVQLNEGHHYTYGRDELIGMLDNALVGARPRTRAAVEFGVATPCAMTPRGERPP